MEEVDVYRVHLPEDDEKAGWWICEISNTQRYKALGNGWTVEVIKHIFRDIIT